MASSNNLDGLFADGELPFGHPGRRFDDTPEGFSQSPWWTKNRSGTTRRTKTGPVGSASITGSGDGPIVRGWRGSSSPVRGGQSRSLADTVDLLGRREHNVVNFAVTG